jgi:hypothetical protein
MKDIPILDKEYFEYKAALLRLHKYNEEAKQHIKDLEDQQRTESRIAWAILFIFFLVAGLVIYFNV